MRTEYAAKESALERHVYEIGDDFKPNLSLFSELMEIPNELPLPGPSDDLFIEYIYIINLDQEVLTMNHSIHWKLGNIPRQDDLWLRAIKNSIYRGEPTISLDVCPEEHMGSPALELPDKNPVIGYEYHVVSPQKTITEAHMAFLTHALANTLTRYLDPLIRYGREWSPDSFPFRELTFALISIASGQAKFHSFPAQECNPRFCQLMRGCGNNHLSKSFGWIDEKWIGDSSPMLEFGSMYHRPGEPPGASPAETTYWFENVLVSLTLVVDGGAITKAVSLGIEQGRGNFQIVVLSLFKVAFVEVSSGKDGKPTVKLSEPIDLSPLRAEHCLSSHPRTRPELKTGMKTLRRRAELMRSPDCTGTIRRLGGQFPGLAALVNFFEVAANRRAASNSMGIFPPELYGLILEFVDYDTWKNCLLVSTTFRSSCLRYYRLNDWSRIVAGPFVRPTKKGRAEPLRLMSFDFENIETGETIPMTQQSQHSFALYSRLEEFNFMPVIGNDPKVLMVDMLMQFEPAEDVPVAADSDDESV